MASALKLFLVGALSTLAVLADDQFENAETQLEAEHNHHHHHHKSGLAEHKHHHSHHKPHPKKHHEDEDDEEEQDPPTRRLRGDAKGGADATAVVEKMLSGNGSLDATAMEKTLTDLMMAGGELSGPLTKSIKQIQHLIEHDLMIKVKEAHTHNQDQLDKLHKEVEQCA